MRAGLLRETIHIYTPQVVINETGEKFSDYIESYKIKAFRKKLSTSVGKGINASEEFIGNTLVFQTRKYSFLNEDVRIRYHDKFYKVILLDIQLDNSYLITCTYINR